MLSRTADSLFWMARYVERAENMARLVDMGRRMAATPKGPLGRRNEWPAVLAAAGVAQVFVEKTDIPTEKASQRDATAFMILDRGNPSSVVSCIEQARTNARSARSALTRDMWEALNDAWIDSRSLEKGRIENGSLSPLIDWIKSVSAKFRGASDGSSLRDDGFEFLRLGLFVERMDNSARLLDVKASPWSNGGDEAIDHYAWISILVAAGVLRAYHFAYKADHDPARIANFLIRDHACPRSLAFCAERIMDHLTRLGRIYGAAPACLEDVNAISDAISDCDVEGLLNGGLHEFLTGVIMRNNRFVQELGQEYYFAPPPAPVPMEPEKAVQTQTATILGGQTQIYASRDDFRQVMA